MSNQNKVRVQAYLPGPVAERIKERAAIADRPESWELLRIIKLGLETAGEKFEEGV